MGIILENVLIVANVNIFTLASFDPMLQTYKKLKNETDMDLYQYYV